MWLSLIEANTTAGDHYTVEIQASDGTSSSSIFITKVWTSTGEGVYATPFQFGVHCGVAQSIRVRLSTILGEGFDNVNNVNDIDIIVTAYDAAS